MAVVGNVQMTKAAEGLAAAMADIARIMYDALAKQQLRKDS